MVLEHQPAAREGQAGTYRAADRHLIDAAQLQAKEDYIGAFRAVQQIRAPQTEHDFKLPSEFHFKYAKAAHAADSLKIAIGPVTRYLMATGKAG